MPIKNTTLRQYQISHISYAIFSLHVHSAVLLAFFPSTPRELIRLMLSWSRKAKWKCKQTVDDNWKRERANKPCVVCIQLYIYMHKYHVHDTQCELFKFMVAIDMIMFDFNSCFKPLSPHSLYVYWLFLMSPLVSYWLSFHTTIKFEGFTKNSCIVIYG